METEGSFTLIAVVGQSADKPDRWNSAGFVHALGEHDHLEMIHAGNQYRTREAANQGAIDAAREIARTLECDDSLAKRARRRD